MPPPQYLNILGDPACVVRTISTGPADGAGYQVVVDAGPEPFVGNPATAADAVWAELFDRNMRDPSVNVPTEVAAATAAREAPQEVPVAAPSLATPLVADQLFANPALLPQADQLPPDLARLLTAEAPSDMAPGEPAEGAPRPASPTQAGAFSGAAMPGPEPTVAVSPPGEGASPAAPATGPAGIPQGQAMREAVAGDGEGIDLLPTDSASSEETAALPAASQQPTALLALGSAALPSASSESSATITGGNPGATSPTASTIVLPSATSTTATTSAATDPSLSTSTSSSSRAALAALQSQPATPTTTDGSTSPSASGPTTAQAQNLLDNLPIRFEANQGQFDPQTQFVAHASNYDLYLGGTQSSFVFAGPTTQDANGNPVSSGPASVVNMQLVGANPTAQSVGVNELVTKTNYLIGSDPNQWVTNVANYAGAQFSNVYNGISLSYYEYNGNLENDFIVSPGADPSQIVSQFSGAQQLSLDAQGNLVIQTANGSLREQRPVAYQVINGAQVAVASNFVLKGNQVSFALGHYDTSQQLVIDPKLAYSTFLGSTGAEIAQGIAVDTQGSAYIVGYTNRPWTPTTGGTITKLGTQAGTDIVVAKLKPDGTDLMYLTYLQGNGNDRGEAIALDSANNAYITGYTTSTSFPGTAGNWQPNNGGGTDALVTELNAGGNGTVFSTFLGGAGTDVGYAIALDASQTNVFIAGSTIGSPTFGGAKKVTPQTIVRAGGTTDVLVAQLATRTGNVVNIGQMGGDSIDIADGIAIDAKDSMYITGFTFSSGKTFPTSGGAFQDTNKGSDDAFVVRIDQAAGGGLQLGYSTLFGGGSDDLGRKIALDPATNNVYIVGSTSTDPGVGFGSAKVIKPAVLSPTGKSGNTDAFVAEFDNNGSPVDAKGNPYYFVYLSGASKDEGYGIALTNGTPLQVYVTGLTFSNNVADGFPTKNPVQARFGGDGRAPRGALTSDAFVAFLDPSKAGGASLIFCTYLGGASTDAGYGIAVDTNNNAYVTGQT